MLVPGTRMRDYGDDEDDDDDEDAIDLQFNITFISFHHAFFGHVKHVAG